MYSGSWPHGPSGSNAYKETKIPPLMDCGFDAGGRGSWNKNACSRFMQKGRGRGSAKSLQSTNGGAVSFSTGWGAKNLKKIKQKPNRQRLGKRGNSHQAIQDIPSLFSTAEKLRPSLLPTPIKGKPGAKVMKKLQNSGVSKGSRRLPGLMQEAPSLIQSIRFEKSVEEYDGSDVDGAVAMQSTSKSSGPRSTRRAIDNQWLKEPPSKEVVDATKPKLTFVCKACKVTCSSEVSLSEHLAGKKHKAIQAEKKQDVDMMTALKNASNQSLHSSETSTVLRKSIHKQPLKDFGASTIPQQSIPLPGTSMQKVFILLCETEDIVGMQYITEYRKLRTLHCRYICELCDHICNLEEMVEHLTCRKHRLRYARTHIFSAYVRMTDYPSFKNMMLPTQLDNFLSRLCAHIVNGDAARGMRSCRTKEYSDESDIGIDVNLFSRFGKQHPSMLEDVLIAESILEEADAIGQSPQRRPQELVGSSSLKYENALTELSELEHVEIGIEENSIIPEPSVDQPSITFLEKKKRSILQSLAANSRSAKLYGLTVTCAKERDSLIRRLEATNDKIRKLHGSSQHSLEFSSDYQEVGSSNIAATRLPIRRRQHTVCDEIPPKRVKDEAYQSASLSDSLEQIQKAVEPIIAETRRRVEQKIYEAIESGNLPAVLNAIKSNPSLHNNLLKWEEGQQTQDDAVPSHRRMTPADSDGPGYPEFSNESTVTRVGGSHFQFDNRNDSYRNDGTDFSIERGLPLHKVRRRELLGSRPTDLDSASLTSRRYDGAGW